MLHTDPAPLGHWLQSLAGGSVLGKGEVTSPGRVDQGTLVSFSLASFSPSLKGVVDGDVLRGGLTWGARGFSTCPLTGE